MLIYTIKFLRHFSRYLRQGWRQTSFERGAGASDRRGGGVKRIYAQVEFCVFYQKGEGEGESECEVVVFNA